MLYDAVACAHRVHLDLRGDPARRGPASAFVEMLWSEGAAHECATLDAVSAQAVDLRNAPAVERRALTARAMDRGAALILGGEVAHGGLLARPDVIRLEACGHVPGDVKAGSAVAGRGDPRPKPAYANQVALAADVLIRTGRLAERRAFVWDRDGAEVRYDLDEPHGSREPTTPWQAYVGTLATVGAIVGGTAATRPAAAAACKLCRWRSHCHHELVATDDVTLVPQLGPSLREALAPVVRTVADLAAIDLGQATLAGGRTVFPGIGADRLARLRDRARLLADPSAGPHAREPLGLARADRELFLDVEHDQFGDRTYLHGIVERTREGDGMEREAFTAHLMADGSAVEEERAFASAWAHLAVDPAAPVYVWSPYERTTFRRLQARHPDVCRADEVEELFTTRVVDLLNDVVASKTDWPLHDMSIQTIAKHLGFAWRDAEPSGAASIEWYRRWLAGGDEAVLGRILDYNEDDCRAEIAILDALLVLPVRGVGERP